MLPQSLLALLARAGLSCLLLCVFAGVPAFGGELIAGPMPGFVGMQGATIWLQTQSSSSVQIRHWAKEDSSKRFLSQPTAIDASTDFTAHIQIPDLDPGKTYVYEVYVNGTKVTFDQELTFHTQPLWQWRTDPPDFDVVVGSCAYINDGRSDRPGEPYGKGFEIFDTMAARKPAFMLWLGDHIYLRPTDVFSLAGIASRYRHVRSFASLQPLLRSTHHVAIWDDHDYGPNNDNRSWILKDAALQQFKQHWANPSYGLNQLPGIFSVVSYGDVDFFLLDNRFYRDDEDSPNQPTKGMFGKRQLAWLQNALLASTANFKIIAAGSQFFDVQPDTEGWHHFPDERGAFLEWFRKATPKGVMFLSGDRHLTKLLRYTNKVPYPLYELTCSPLTSGTRDLSQEAPTPSLVHETMVGERNFCTLSFQRDSANRNLTIEVFNTHGTRLWSRIISQTELE